MDAFDGAGRGYRQPGYGTILMLGLLIVVLIVAVWIAGGGGGGVVDLPAATPAT